MEKISKREFARRVGVSDTAIHKAIKAGKIARGHDPNGGRNSIIYEIALEEYRATHNPIQANFGSKPKPRKKYGKKKPPEEETEGTPEAVTADAGSLSFQAVGEDGQSVIDFNTSRAKKMQYEAKIKRLEYEQRTGKLVDRESVYKGLFQIGKEIRNTMQALPDRVIDHIMASETRNEGHSLLVRAITDALEEFSNSGEILEKHILKNE